MSNPFDKPVELSPLRIAEDINGFVHSDTGVRYLAALKARHEQLHHDAEDSNLSNDKRIGLLEQAKGVKFAMDYLSERNTNYESGFYDVKKRR